MRVLYCTVGGSHQPVVRSIQTHRPQRVVFVCSDDDKTTGRKGSWTTIVGAGSQCSSVQGGPLDLPNIPTQLSLAPASWTVVRIPSDDPFEAVEILRPMLASDIETEGPGLVGADYTGGTKGMTAALFFASAHTTGVKLCVVTGPRSDLVKVADGSERGRSLPDAARILVPIRIEEVERAWDRFSYAEAARMIEGLASNNSPQLDRILVASRAYAAWDSGAYEKAAALLRSIGRYVPGSYLGALSKLVRSPNVETEPWAICDLVLAGLRRAQVEQFDTAILLYYRAVEKIAQWTLAAHHSIDTANVLVERVEIQGLATHGIDGKLKLSLHSAWTAIGRLAGPFAELARTTEESRMGFATARNQSRFAHGNRPLSSSDFDKCLSYFERRIWPRFLDVAFPSGQPFEQLPRALDRLIDG